jgi:acyl carrier protein
MYEQIVAVLAKQLQIDPSSITPETDIVEDLGADSLDVVEILMELEQAFSLSIPDEEIVRFRTPAAIGAYIEEQTA